ncbi:MAG TPA: lipid A biosynthesis acyltransferase [Ideonella sp.]|uniref:lysophospholipid acyltransferase family protein n=1 Tax=Ideonella sp. TaxID=1929293 RepID=UPI002C464B99|nr:lipid A biosynthesis acyltransferase [Ideonella sp.]HSI50145.1 lipid A biosynthesis acyltransferase [Ideonella sp.]
MSKRHKTGWRAKFSHGGARALIFGLWLLHWFPTPVLAFFGEVLGRLLWPLLKSRRRIVRTNLRLCFPEKSEDQREQLGREHFVFLVRSLLERCVLWFGSEARVRRLVHVEGDVHLAERTGAPIMWLLPHFVGMDYAAPALTLFQSRPAINIYQRQSNPVLDARLHKSRARFGNARLIERRSGIRPIVRAIQDGAGFVNLPDMDFGRFAEKDAVFVPFFGVQTATLASPARMVQSMKMRVQPMVITMLPRGRGYRVSFQDPPPGFHDPDPVLATAAFNRWLEARIREQPAQYYWVHRRFKTRPPGEPRLY